MLTLSTRRKRLGLFYSTIFYVNYFDREQMQVEYRNFASTDFTLPMLEMIYNCLRMDWVSVNLWKRKSTRFFTQLNCVVVGVFLFFYFNVTERRTERSTRQERFMISWHLVRQRSHGNFWVMFCLEDVLWVSDTEAILWSWGLDVDLLCHVGSWAWFSNSVLRGRISHCQGVARRFFHVMFDRTGLTTKITLFMLNAWLYKHPPGL